MKLHHNQLFVIAFIFAAILATAMSGGFTATPGGVAVQVRHPVLEAETAIVVPVPPTLPAEWTDEWFMSDSGSFTYDYNLENGPPCKETVTVTTNERSNANNSCTESRTTTKRTLVCTSSVNPGVVYSQEENLSDQVTCSPAGCGKDVTLSGKDKDGKKISITGSLRSSSKITSSAKDHNGNASSETIQISQIRDDLNGDGLDNDPSVTGYDPNAAQSCFYGCRAGDYAGVDTNRRLYIIGITREMNTKNQYQSV